jgi:predicted enzyme related to lactoylglutathione lyase
MSTNPVTAGATASDRARTADMKIEVITLPVSDVDRAKAFYEGIGWRLDADLTYGDGRVVQFTPPGSTCSVHFGKGLTPATPGASQNQFLVVSDIEAVREQLTAGGASVSEPFHFTGPARFGDRVSGPAPEHASYGSYASFQDPDGNTWLLQEITTRFPGRIDSDGTTFASIADLASAMRRASVAHGEHERRMGGEYDVNWPDWYAEYMVREQSGGELPT